MNDLVDFFKKQNRKRKRGPVKSVCMTKGPAVTICSYYIQRTIPLVIIGGSPWGVEGPAVVDTSIKANDNNK